MKQDSYTFEFGWPDAARIISDGADDNGEWFDLKVGEAGA